MGVFIEMNLRKTKWLIFCTYGPPSWSLEYFCLNLGFVLDTYQQTHENILFAGDLNFLLIIILRTQWKI